MKRVFDRITHFDRKSKAWPIMAIIPQKRRKTKIWACETYLNQGSEGACTGFATSHEAAAEPVPVLGITNAIARALYYRARQLDEWPGEEYEGSSVLGAVKAATEKGWYGEYRWAFGESDLAMAIGYCGPAILGINWYEGMSKPDKDGVIRISGDVVGGHAILCLGYDATQKRYLLHNSWGKSWGLGGRCWISAKDMKRLLKERGEACIPIVRKGI